MFEGKFLSEYTERELTEIISYLYQVMHDIYYGDEDERRVEPQYRLKCSISGDSIIGIASDGSFDDSLDALYLYPYPSDDDCPAYFYDYEESSVTSCDDTK